MIFDMSSCAGSDSDREPIGNQETTKQSLFWMYQTHGGPVMMVLKVDSKCRGWDGSSWDTHDAS